MLLHAKCEQAKMGKIDAQGNLIYVLCVCQLNQKPKDTWYIS